MGSVFRRPQDRIENVKIPNFLLFLLEIYMYIHYIITDEKVNTQTWLLEQWYNRPVLVIWHKDRSFGFDCLHGFDTLLDKLERQASSKNVNDGILRELEEIVSFCRANPEIAFKTEGSSCRLLTLCVQLKASKDILRLLDVLALCQGICSGSMPDVMAEAIQLVGLEACSSSLGRLISVARAEDQMRHYVRLVTTMLDRGYHQAAVATASHICKILSSGNIICSLEIPVLALCVDAMIRLDESPLTNHPQRLVNLARQIKEKFSRFLSLLQLLACVQHCLNARPAEKIPTSAITWFCDIGLHLASIEIPAETPSEQLLSAVKLFVSCGDEALLGAFIRQLTTNQNQKNNNLKRLLASEDAWKFAEESADGKGAISSLVDKRIQWLVELPKPVASWAFPNAEVVGHPEVQEFMRSNQQCMTYANFNNLQHARNWARKHFSFSQIAEAHPFGAGRAAYCEINKVRQLCNGNKNYLASQQELMGLIDKRLKKLGDAACTVVLDAKTDAIRLLEVQSARNVKTTPQPGPSTAAVQVATPQVPVQKKIEATRIQMSNIASSSSTPTAPASKSAVRVTKKAAKANPVKLVQVNPSASPLLNNLENKVATPVQRTMPVASTPVATPKRPGIAKRPLSSSFLPSNVYPPAVMNSPKVSPFVSYPQQNLPVKRLIDLPSSADVSPSKRVKK